MKYHYFLSFGGDISLTHPNSDSNSITISVRFRSETKLFWKLPFPGECFLNSRLSAFQRTKNHQKPFTEFRERVRHKQCQPNQIWTISVVYPGNLLFCSISAIKLQEPSLLPNKTMLDHRKLQIWSEISEFHHFEFRETAKQTVRGTVFTSVSERFR